MNLAEYAKTLLLGPTLEDKLLTSSEINTHELVQIKPVDLPTTPGRSKKISFDNRQFRFPRKSSLHLSEKSIRAITNE